MSGDFDEQDRQAIDDAERDLAVLLSAEPSPEFRAHVRARIDMAPRGPIWWTWPRGLIVATAVALAAIAVGMLFRDVARNAPARSPQQARAVPDVNLPAPVISRANQHRDAIEVALKSGRPVVAVPVPRHGDAVAFTPEVIVDPAQASAFRRLLAAARQLPRDAVIEEQATDALNAGVRSIPLSPVVVDPLEVPDIKASNKGVER
jgi:hypothetical protein